MIMFTGGIADICSIQLGWTWEWDIRGFLKVDHLGIDARIVLEQKNLRKKTLTGLELQTLGLSVVLTFSPHTLPLC